MTRFYHNFLYPRGSKTIYKSSFIGLLTIFILQGLLVSSCEKDPTPIGKNLFPGRDFVTIMSTDTITPVAFTMYDDSVRSDSPPISYLGSMTDPYFGTTTASFVSQLRLKEEWVPGDYKIDSMKLVLEFTNVMGGEKGTHTLSLFEIDQVLRSDEQYYSNTKVPLTGFRVDLPLPALKKDTINNIVIKFTDLALAERLLSDTTKLFHNNKVPDFRSFFKGFYFTLSSTEDPVLASLSLQFDEYYPYRNYFVVYLSDKNGNKTEYLFILESQWKCALFNLYNHDFSTAHPDKNIKHYDDMTYRDSVTYVQGLNGVYTRILFPGLKMLKESGNLTNVAVNKASLTIPYYSDYYFLPSNLPSILYLRYRTEKGDKPLVPDYNVDEYHSFYDGTPDTTKKAYHFNIATFVQEYLEDKTGNILPELEITQSGMQSVILKANGNKTPAKFDFTYTLF